MGGVLGGIIILVLIAGMILILARRNQHVGSESKILRSSQGSSWRAKLLVPHEASGADARAELRVPQEVPGADVSMELEARQIHELEHRETVHELR